MEDIEDLYRFVSECAAPTSDGRLEITLQWRATDGLSGVVRVVALRRRVRILDSLLDPDRLVTEPEIDQIIGQDIDRITGPI